MQQQPARDVRGLQRRALGRPMGEMPRHRYEDMPARRKCFRRQSRPPARLALL
jgi:hypothetical protein